MSKSKNDSASTNVWHPSVEVESNAYNWGGEPALIERKSDLPDCRGLHVDLFSGCGGFSVGFEMAGFATAAAVDIHPPSLKTLTANHPHVAAICGDIRKIESGTIADLLPTRKDIPCVVTAGVPCQGFSLSNRKRHSEDKRNFLFREFIRIARDLEPDAVVLENVSGLVSTAGGNFKTAIADAIRELGYDVHFAMLNAAEFGVPQTRKRVFFVGVRAGTPWKFPFGQYDGSTRPFNTVGDAILGDLPSLASGEGAVQYCGVATTALQKVLRGRTRTLRNHMAPSHPDETVSRIAGTLPGEPMYSEFRQRIRLHPERPSPTQICGGIRPQFQFGHPTQARGLTIRERARLQSFPDSYEFHGGLVQGRVQTGNAVPPFVANAVAAQLLRALAGVLLTGENCPVQERLELR